MSHTALYDAAEAHFAAQADALVLAAEAAEAAYFAQEHLRDEIGSAVVQLARDAPHIGAEHRRALAERGHALPDGSYPIPDVHHLHSAATLAASHHGDWKAAQALIRKRAHDFGVDVTSLPGFGPDDTSDQVAASGMASRIAEHTSRYTPAGYLAQEQQAVGLTAGEDAYVDAAWADSEVGRIGLEHPGMINLASAGSTATAVVPSPAVSQRQYDDQPSMGLSAAQEAAEVDRLLALAGTVAKRPRRKLGADLEHDDDDCGTAADSKTDVQAEIQRYLAMVSEKPQSGNKAGKLPAGTW